MQRVLANGHATSVTEVPGVVARNTLRRFMRGGGPALVEAAA